MADGKFIVFEGIDGSGTTTQTKATVDWLRGKNIDVVQTHEPTTGVIGKIIRKALSRRMPGCEGEELEADFFALLFATDRMHHMRSVVVPALDGGQWVVSDRCYLSSFAYQSVNGDLDWVRMLNRNVRRADITFLLDLEVDTAYQRLNKRTLYNRLEVFETPEMMSKVRPNYLKIAEVLAAEGDRIVTIDASRSRSDIAAEVQRCLSELL